jgi:iron complex transport system ATP-binding protein
MRGDSDLEGQQAGASSPDEAVDTARSGGAQEGSPVDIEDLAVGYPTTDGPVVDCETLHLPAGEVTALVGPNGSGKSTLLKAIGGQLEPERGTALVDGEAVHELGSSELARRLGLLSQEHDAPASVTVEELAYHGRYPHRGFFESVGEEDRLAVERALSLAGVEHLRDQRLANLSGGQKQLAWIAMVLAQDTDVLLLDEPTTFLDLRHQLTVLEVVRTLVAERDVTVGVVLHDVAQAARFADNLVALDDGALYDWGPPDEVVTEKLLTEVFGVEAAVLEGEDGPRVVPKRPLE